MYDTAAHVISRCHLLPATMHVLLLPEAAQPRNAELFRTHLPHRAINLQLPDVQGANEVQGIEALYFQSLPCLLQAADHFGVAVTRVSIL